MVLKAFHDMFEMEGDPVELALYTVTALELLRKQSEIDQEQKDREFLDKFGDISIWDLIKMERGETGETDEDKTNGGQTE